MKMFLVDSNHIIASIGDRWKHQYFVDGKWEHVDDPRGSEGIYKELLAPNLTIDDIERIIGNDSWTRETCDVCGKKLIMRVAISGYDEQIELCKECLYKGFKLMEDA